ncbi:MAG: hypothetical protein WBW04_19600 [Nitrolancea sp.]
MALSTRFVTRRACAIGLVGAAVLLFGACGTSTPTFAVRAGSDAAPTSSSSESELTPTGPLPTTTTQSSPASSSNQGPKLEFSLAITADFAAPPTAEEFARWYDLIVSGTVEQVLPAQWGTPDGKRPKSVSYATVPGTYPIITPAVVKLDGAPLLDRYGVDFSSGQIVVAAFGGQVGNDEVTINDPSQRLLVGQHLMMGLLNHPFMGSQDPILYQTPVGPAWTLGMVYWLESDGLALCAMPNATPVATQDLVQAIVAASRATPTP